MVITVVTALVAILASLYVLATPKKYASTSTLFVSTPSSDPASSNVYQGAQYSQLRVQSYVNMVSGPELAQQVINQLHLKMSAGALSSEISATNQANTVLLNVTVTDHDPDLALRINQAVVAQLIQTITQIETPPGAKVPLIKVTVVDPARFSATPVSPKKTTDITLGIIVGLLLGLGIAVAREVLDNSVKDLRDVHGLADVPVVAALPLDPGVSAQPLISALDKQSPRAEAFRVLRTNLQFLSVDSTSKIYVVSSAVPGEGKSTTVTNLAISLAQAGKSVLLLDGDLRRPRVASLLGLVPSVGLTTALVGELPVAECIQEHVESGLKVLTAGAVPPNPAELLQTKAMLDVLAELRQQFDIVLIDAPPLLPVTDAALLGSEADGVLLVVRHSRTSKDELQGAVHRLEAVDAHLSGVIFNMVPRRGAGGGAGYSYSYAYGYGYAAAKQQTEKMSRKQRRAAVAEAKAAVKQGSAETMSFFDPDEQPATSDEQPADDVLEAAVIQEAASTQPEIPDHGFNAPNANLSAFEGGDYSEHPAELGSESDEPGYAAGRPGARRADPRAGRRRGRPTRP